MPEGLKLEGTACGLAGWSLAWKPVQGAEAGYAVLLADADGDGKFRVLGETKAANQVEFPLPASRVKGIARPVFSVVARVPKGDTCAMGNEPLGC